MANVHEVQLDSRLQSMVLLLKRMQDIANGKCKP